MNLMKNPVVRRNSHLGTSGAQLSAQAGTMWSHVNFRRPSGVSSLTERWPDEDPDNGTCDMAVVLPLHGFFGELYDSGLAASCTAFKLFRFPNPLDSEKGPEPNPQELRDEFNDSDQHLLARSLFLPLLFVNIQDKELPDIIKASRDRWMASVGINDMWYAWCVNIRRSGPFNYTQRRGMSRGRREFALIPSFSVMPILIIVQKTYVFEHGARTYDLENVTDMFQFAAAVIRIRTLGHELHKRMSAFTLSSSVPQSSSSCGNPAQDDSNIPARVRELLENLTKYNEKDFTVSDWLWTREAQTARRYRDMEGWSSSKSN